jgi:hypothetical protein
MTRAAQLPHYGDVGRELALEPRGGDEQLRAPSSLAEEACRLRKLGGGKWLGQVANRNPVTSLAGDFAQSRFFALR